MCFYICVSGLLLEGGGLGALSSEIKVNTTKLEEQIANSLSRFVFLKKQNVTFNIVVLYGTNLLRPSSDAVLHMSRIECK